MFSSQHESLLVLLMLIAEAHHLLLTAQLIEVA